MKNKNELMILQTSVGRVQTILDTLEAQAKALNGRAQRAHIAKAYKGLTGSVAIGPQVELKKVLETARYMKEVTCGLAKSMHDGSTTASEGRKILEDIKRIANDWFNCPPGFREYFDEIERHAQDNYAADSWKINNPGMIAIIFDWFEKGIPTSVIFKSYEEINGFVASAKVALHIFTFHQQVNRVVKANWIKFGRPDFHLAARANGLQEKIEKAKEVISRYRDDLAKLGANEPQLEGWWPGQVVDIGNLIPNIICEQSLQNAQTWMITKVGEVTEHLKSLNFDDSMIPKLKSQEEVA